MTGRAPTILRRLVGGIVLAAVALIAAGCFPVTATTPWPRQEMPPQLLGMWRLVDGDLHLPQAVVMSNGQAGGLITAYFGGLDPDEAGDGMHLRTIVRNLDDGRLLVCGICTMADHFGDSRTPHGHAAATAPAPDPADADAGQDMMECFTVRIDGDRAAVQSFTTDEHETLDALTAAGWKRVSEHGHVTAIEMDAAFADFLAAHVAVLEKLGMRNGTYGRLVLSAAAATATAATPGP